MSDNHAANHAALRQSTAEASAHRCMTGYQNISPRIEFGRGGLPLLERLVGYDDHDQDFAVTTDLEATTAGGWIALETAAILPNGRVRDRQIQKSMTRFERAAAQLHSDNLIDRGSAYYARMGLLASYAYQQPTTTTIEDNPGLYAAALEDILVDRELNSKLPYVRRGYISEFVVGALASQLNYLTLPAGYRHDRPTSIEIPTAAHDFQIWLQPPDALPAKPDRRVQVKSTHAKSNKRYARNITIVNTAEFHEQSRDQLAWSLVDLYSGQDLSRRRLRCIKLNAQILESILRAPVGEDEYTLRGAQMRGGGKNHSRFIMVKPKN